MNRRILCLMMTFVILFTSFIPFAEADSIMYASDGRTINVNSADIEDWKNVGWFETAEDAKIITMYSLDGRTIDIPQYYRSAYQKVGWYNTREEVVLTMYSTDGRSLEVYKALSEEFRKVGWYYNLSDVTEKMYDAFGNEYTVYKDNLASERKKGLSTNKNDVMQLMFSLDGRFLYVPFDTVEEYQKVGWYLGGTKLDTTRPMVALTFDDGPGKYTAEILSCLEKYNVRATFFVQGKNVSGYKSVLARAVENGNEIGNHTWSHVNLSGSSTAVISQQISSTNTAIYNATGKYPTLYRPPYGSYNKSVLNTVPLASIMWSVDTLDWKTRSAEKTLLSVKKDAKNGSIILMHDIHRPTADAVESVVRHLLLEGFQLVTVSELISAQSGSAPVSGRVYMGTR